MTGLLAFFPAAGSGGITQQQLEKLAGRRGLAFAALPNPPSIAALESGDWERQCGAAIGAAITEADRVVLVGHCMGGFSAIRLARWLDRPADLLLINTPCPDEAGRIPTMTHLSDAAIGEILAHDGFPQDLLDDEDMLTEIADQLRAEAAVADRVAEWVSTAGPLKGLHVFSTRGDRFIPPSVCAGWHGRTTGDFHLTVAEGGHTIDEDTADVLDRALEAV